MKPVIGCEVYVADDRRSQQKGYAHLTLLAESNEGYGNLIKLSSLGYLEGYYYKPRVDWELLERHAKGLVALSGCLSGRVCKALEENRPLDAEAELDRLAQIVRARQRLRRAPERGPRRAAADQPAARRARREGEAAASSRPATSTTSTPSDAASHEALLCIQSGDSLKNPNHWRFETNEFYFKTPEEMALDFPGHEEAMRRTLEVAERCNVEIELGRILLPSSRRRTAVTPSSTSSSCARRGSRGATGR